LAKLKVLPEQGIISGFRGKLDFYEYMGIPVVRKWPRSPGKRRSPAVEAQWPVFAEAAALWNELSTEVQDAYRRMAEGGGLTGRDLFTRSYISGIFSYPPPV